MEAHFCYYDCPTCHVPHTDQVDLDTHITNQHSGTAPEFVPQWDELSHEQHVVKKYGMTKHSYTVQCTNRDQVEPTAENIEKLFTSMVDGLTAGLDPSHYIGFSIQAPSLDYPITMPFTRLRNFNAAHMFNSIQRTLNSNQDFCIDDRLKIDLTHVEIPEGRGYTGKPSTYIL